MSIENLGVEDTKDKLEEKEEKTSSIVVPEHAGGGSRTEKQQAHMEKLREPIMSTEENAKRRQEIEEHLKGIVQEKEALERELSCLEGTTGNRKKRGTAHMVFNYNIDDEVLFISHRISLCNNFERLYEEIKNIGKFKIENTVYLSDEIIDMIEKVKREEQDIITIPSMFALRDTVSKIIYAEGSDSTKPNPPKTPSPLSAAAKLPLEDDSRVGLYDKTHREPNKGYGNARNREEGGLSGSGTV